VKVGPGEVSPQIFLASQTHDGIFTVHLTVQDDLAADTRRRRQPVAASGKCCSSRAATVLLEKALRAASNLQLTVART